MNKSQLLLTALFLVAATWSPREATAAGTLLVGWNHFEPNDDLNRVSDATPNTVAAGFSGELGTGVNPASATQGGGLKSNATVNFNGNNTYGASYVIPAGESGDPSGLIINTYSNNNKYCDISVTNNSGADVTIDYIHFDAALNFGATGAILKVSHFSILSALADGTNNRVLASMEFPAGVFAWNQLDISTAVMPDVVLSTGETTAFRIFIEPAAADPAIIKLDNIAISTGELPPPPAPKWAGYDVLADGWVDTTPWLGWINVAGGDWVWNVSLAKYIYLPENFVSQGGAWTYFGN